MKRLKKIIATVAICTMAVSVMGCKMIEKTPEAIQNTVLAKVGDEKVTKADLDKDLQKYGIVDQLKQTYGADYANNPQVAEQLKKQKQQIVESIVDEKIILKKATELGLKPSDDELDKDVDEAISYYKNMWGEDKYATQIQTLGFTEDSFKEFQRNQAIANAVIKDIIKDISVTDDDIQSYYDENKDTKYTIPGDVNFDKSLETAKALKSQLDSGSDFAELAKEKSEDTGTKENGGSLGFIEYNSTKYVPEFMDGFKNLKEGEISEPVKSKFGYHIIKVTGVTDKGAEVSHILVADKGESKVTPLDQIKEDVRGELEQKKKQDAYKAKLDEWKQNIKVKIYDDRL